MSKKPRKPREAPVAKAFAGVVLAIDPGACAGWAMFQAGELRGSGTVEGYGERDRVCRAVVDQAFELDLPFVAVVELWTTFGDRLGRLQILGMGAARGNWFDSLDRCGVGKARVVDANLSTWRRDLFGKVRALSEEWKAMATSYASARAARTVKDHNEAEAICIGVWALHSAAVHRFEGT